MWAILASFDPFTFFPHTQTVPSKEHIYEK